MDGILETTDDWLEKRRKTEGAEGLWRIGDNLYNLDEFAKRHPGGDLWIRLTKGTDITTAFYSYHVTTSAEDLLPGLFARPARSPSTETYTFHEDGFYMTLRKRIRQALKENGALVKKQKTKSKVIGDLLVVSALATGLLAARTQSTWWAIASGLLLGLSAGVAHNFFHQKLNFRRFYFDLTFMSSREWMVSHALSHHLFPNTLKDLEITMFRPAFEFLPKADKTFAQRYLSWVISPIVYLGAAHAQFAKRITRLSVEDLVSLVVPAVMLLGGATFYDTWKTWTIVLLSCSFYFVGQGLSAGHHHPDVFHEGDAPRVDRDWGLFQLDATSERADISQLYSTYPTLAVALELSHFGAHRLHHLFPTLDGAVLPLLEPVLSKTLQDFDYEDLKGVDGKTVWTLLTGKFRQLARIRCRTRPFGSSD